MTARAEQATVTDRTALVVNLSAVTENLRRFRNQLEPRVQIMAVVKADGYGLGADVLALHLERLDVDSLAVATAAEGAKLRKVGVRVPILVLRGSPREVPIMQGHRLTAVVTSEEMLRSVLALEHGERLAVHLELETGMHRSGLAGALASDASRALRGHRILALQGLMTSLLGTTDPALDNYSRHQLALFDDMCSAIDPRHRLTWHAAATSAALRTIATQYDCVRLGLGLLGVYPSDATRTLALEPVTTFMTCISHMVSVPTGGLAGYNGLFVAGARGARLGVLPIGYYDGMPRGAGGNGVVLVSGAPRPIVGTVAMDSTLIDVTDSPAQSGSEVIVFGGRGLSQLPIEQVAEAAGTVSYEMLCRVGRRVPRVYEVDGRQHSTSGDL